MTAIAEVSPVASSAARSTARLPIVDAARGVAIAAMVVYHAAWDVTFFDLAPVDAVGSPFWRNFAHAIASSFLLLVGVSLVLAKRPTSRPGAGQPAGAQHAQSWRGYLRRLAVIVAAASAVTLATWIATPERFIYFGILHCIAAASVLALPFLQAPAAVVAIVGAAVVALPFWFSSPLFDPPWLAWLGLGVAVPNTSDYVPIFPWFGAVLIGVAAGKVGLPALAAGAAGRWTPTGAVGRVLTWSGRHSLVIYLTHQLVLMGLFWALFQVTGPNGTAQAMRMRDSCISGCVETEADAGQCRLTCACTMRTLRREGLLRTLAEGQIGDEQRPRLSAIIRQCRTVTPPVPDLR